MHQRQQRGRRLSISNSVQYKRDSLTQYDRLIIPSSDMWWENTILRTVWTSTAFITWWLVGILFVNMHLPEISWISCAHYKRQTTGIWKRVDKCKELRPLIVSVIRCSLRLDLGYFFGPGQGGLEVEGVLPPMHSNRPKAPSFTFSTWNCFSF